jgi:hypothetical protein
MLTLFSSVKNQLPSKAAPPTAPPDFPNYQPKMLVARDRAKIDNHKDNDKNTIFGWHMWMGLPRYICIALPNEEPNITRNSYLGPVKYWLEEPTYHHWLTR